MTGMKAVLEHDSGRRTFRLMDGDGNTVSTVRDWEVFYVTPVFDKEDMFHDKKFGHWRVGLHYANGVNLSFKVGVAVDRYNTVLYCYDGTVLSLTSVPPEVKG